MWQKIGVMTTLPDANITKEQYNQAYQELEMLIGRVGMNSKLVHLDDATRKRVEVLENIIFTYQEAQLKP